MAEHPSFDVKVRALLVILDAAKRMEASRDGTEGREPRLGHTDRAAAGRQPDRVELSAA